MKTATIPERSAESEMLYTRIMQMTEDEVVTYEVLSAEIGRNVQLEARGYLATARNMAAREGRQFECVRGIGLKRLTPSGIILAGQSGIQHIRRSAKRTGRKIANADYARLSRQEQNKSNVMLSTLGALTFLTSAPQQKTLSGAVAITQKRLPLQKTLKLFES